LVLFIILGVIVLITFVVLGVLLFLLSKEGQSSLQMRSAERQSSLEIETLTKENGSLKSQLESTNAKARLLEEEISRAKLSASKPGPDEALRHELTSLKYELIKARAQSSGLERVSFNYKNQLADFFKKVNAAQVSNDHLSQVKNRLEGMVQEIKLQNEELLKKDQLAQFELEKNRSRLVSLEREYEGLKARLST